MVVVAGAPVDVVVGATVVVVVGMTVVVVGGSVVVVVVVEELDEHEEPKLDPASCP